MSLRFIFWLLMLIWLIFGIWSVVGTPFNIGIMGGQLLLFLVIFILGWKVFGFIIQDGGPNG